MNFYQACNSLQLAPERLSDLCLQLQRDFPVRKCFNFHRLLYVGRVSTDMNTGPMHKKPNLGNVFKLSLLLFFFFFISDMSL